MTRKYTVLPDPPDQRDYVFKAPRFLAAVLPSEVDLRKWASRVVDQLSLGSCTSNAIVSGLREFIQVRDTGKYTELSRLYHYWHEREIMGTINEDSGAYIRDGMKVLQQKGCPPEIYCPYDVDKFRDRPSLDAELQAPTYKISEYHRVTTYTDLKTALAAGLPVVLGIKVFTSFESYNANLTGMIPLPLPNETFLGGHAVLAMGYKTFNDGIEYILVKNSWGENWGQFGYCYIPKSYFDAGHVTDMWTGDVEKYVPVTPEDLTFKDSIDTAVKYGIFDTPEFWVNFEQLFHDGKLENRHFEYVLLGFRKWAADKINSQRGL